MRQISIRASAVFLALAIAQPALAQGHDHTCADEAAAPLPEALAGWNDRSPMVAAGNAADAASATLQPGSAVDATLISTAQIKYAVRPEKPGGSVSFGGIFSFDVADAGTYRVALGSGAWIDVLNGTAVQESVAHGHGPACSGIRKMVDFTLQPGTYTLQIAANGQENLPLLVARLP